MKFQEGAVAICHGATGKGNDQFISTLSKALAPDIKIITGETVSGNYSHVKMKSNIASSITRIFPLELIKSYSRDPNLWHISHEGLELEDPANSTKLRPPFSFSSRKSS